MPKYIAIFESCYRDSQVWNIEDASNPEDTPLAALKAVGMDPTRDGAKGADGPYQYRTTLYECVPVEFEIKLSTKAVTTKVKTAKIILKKA